MNEDIVEQAALGWFEAHGYNIARGADISPGGDTPLRDSYEDVVLMPRLMRMGAGASREVFSASTTRICHIDGS